MACQSGVRIGSFASHATKSTQLFARNLDFINRPLLRSSWRSLKTKGQGQRHSLAPVGDLEGAEKRFIDLLRPLGFTVLVSGCSFAGCAVWQYEAMRKKAKNLLHPHESTKLRSAFLGKAGSFRQKVNIWWNDLSRGEKTVACIIGLNVGVFMLWRVSPLQRVMVKYFTSSPMSGAPCWSMLFSTFSHYGAFHLFANMYVLWSFAPVVTQMLGPEQFLATYITAGMVSSFTSYVYRIARKSRIASVGASGAILGILAVVCVSRPDTALSIAFVDQIFPHSFAAGTGLKCLILLDLCGVLSGWKFLDHAGHLGGALFGIWYVKYGHKHIWHRREALMKKWHSLRGQP